MDTVLEATETVTRDGFVRRGDWTKERHEKPRRSSAEVAADILRLQAEHPERLTIKPVRYTGANPLDF